MDLQPFHAYLDRTMLRRFLTLLAMLTGFAVLAAPVQARQAPESAAACEAVEAAMATDVAATYGIEISSVTAGRGAPIALPLPVIDTLRLAPTVALRIDRSRE